MEVLLATEENASEWILLSRPIFFWLPIKQSIDLVLSAVQIFETVWTRDLRAILSEFTGSECGVEWIELQVIN